MILVIGSAASGKRDYVKSLGYGESDISDAVLDEKPVLYGLERLVAQAPAESGALLPELLKKDVVVCCEVGSGVIPVVRHERETREQTGRLCNRLAQQADQVVRLVCGIPMVIKGS